MGYSWPGLLRTGHVGGYVLSGPSLSWLQEEGLFNTTLCPENYSGSERIRYCMQKSGVYSGIDPDFHKLFLPRKNISDTKPKLILMWNTILRGDTTDLVKMLSENCPLNCILSFDQSHLDKADAVVFNFHKQHGKGLKKITESSLPLAALCFRRNGIER